MHGVLAHSVVGRKAEQRDTYVGSETGPYVCVGWGGHTARQVVWPSRKMGGTGRQGERPAKVYSDRQIQACKT